MSPHSKAASRFLDMKGMSLYFIFSFILLSVISSFHPSIHRMQPGITCQQCSISFLIWAASSARETQPSFAGRNSRTVFLSLTRNNVLRVP
ncbi:hypothetical protein R3P38DRAFT_2901524 [Favolaschia claudopus]|uniref:Secreted protein n=1 Tax=Favolaschia claudopus TaxID=2862362 RepID=A0AAW0CKT0_9AGAR